MGSFEEVLGDGVCHNSKLWIQLKTMEGSKVDRLGCYGSGVALPAQSTYV